MAPRQVRLEVIKSVKRIRINAVKTATVLTNTSVLMANASSKQSLLNAARTMTVQEDIRAKIEIVCLPAAGKMPIAHKDMSVETASVWHPVLTVCLIVAAKTLTVRKATPVEAASVRS
jgi:hypothetical protein